MIDLKNSVYNMNSHAMLDIETVATNNAAMLSISAWQFNPFTGEIFEKFEVFLEIDSQLAIGLEVSHSTLMFWLTAEDDARRDLINKCKSSGQTIQTALQMFSQWMQVNCIDKVWGKGPSFDCSILSNAYNKCNLQKPWEYRDEFCVRTIIALDKSVKERIDFEGIPHKGLDDAKHQIKQICDIIELLHSYTRQPELKEAANVIESNN